MKLKATSLRRWSMVLAAALGGGTVMNACQMRTKDIFVTGLTNFVELNLSAISSALLEDLTVGGFEGF